MLAFLLNEVKELSILIKAVAHNSVLVSDLASLVDCHQNLCSVRNVFTQIRLEDFLSKGDDFIEGKPLLGGPEIRDDGGHEPAEFV